MNSGCLLRALPCRLEFCREYRGNKIGCRRLLPARYRCRPHGHGDAKPLLSAGWCGTARPDSPPSALVRCLRPPDGLYLCKRSCRKPAVPSRLAGLTHGHPTGHPASAGNWLYGPRRNPGLISVTGRVAFLNAAMTHSVHRWSFCIYTAPPSASGICRRLSR